METAKLLKLFGAALSEPRVRWRRSSRYAEIIGVECGNDQWVIKLPSQGVFQHLPDAERSQAVEHINGVTEFFRDELARHDVPLPSVYGIYSVNVCPVHLVSDEGEDCMSFVQRCPERVRSVLPAIVGAISKLLVEGQRCVGIDARLSNFATRDGDLVVYIDIFPPLVLHEGKYWVHYPNPSDAAIVAAEVERKFTPLGVLRRLRFDLMAVDPDWEAPFAHSLDRLPDSLRCFVRSALESLPDSRVLSLDARQRLALLEGTTDVDTLRELAIRLIPYPAGAIRQRIMEAVFDNTSQAAAADAKTREERLQKFLELMRPFL